MLYFNNKGDFLSGQVFDRDGYIKEDVQKEIYNVHVNSYPAMSDLVKCYYTLKIGRKVKDIAHQSIFAKL